ncbi:MAG: hypothetical protein Q7U97_05415 [Rhodocyclaceae bacterium]|nr:hypothetical protein [Rhodocyclaceae bacterium]
MKNVAWRAIDRRELAALLTDGDLLASQAVGETTIYRLAADGREIIALALPDGRAIILEPLVPAAARRRRRIDSGPVNPASR